MASLCHAALHGDPSLDQRRHRLDAHGDDGPASGWPVQSHPRCLSPEGAPWAGRRPAPGALLLRGIHPPQELSLPSSAPSVRRRLPAYLDEKCSTPIGILSTPIGYINSKVAAKKKFTRATGSRAASYCAATLFRVFSIQPVLPASSRAPTPTPPFWRRRQAPPRRAASLLGRQRPTTSSNGPRILL